MNSAYDQIREALEANAAGLTARQLHAKCDEIDSLNELVVQINKLKSEGKIKADGMRDSQVVYKLGKWAGWGVDTEAIHNKQAVPEKPLAPSSAPAVVAPENLSKNLVPTKPKRTGGGLREGLFDMMERLRDGSVDVGTAKAYAALAMTICKSIEIQLEYERMKIAKELPGELGDMTMVPALEAK